MPDPLPNHNDVSDATESTIDLSSDALNLPDPLQQILRWITRQRQVSLAKIAQHFEQEEAAIHPKLTALVEQGLVQVMDIDGEFYYQPKLATRKGRNVPSQIWEKLEE